MSLKHPSPLAFRRYVNAATRDLALANTYADDGALMTAADCLERAADKLRKAHAEKTAYLESGGKRVMRRSRN